MCYICGREYGSLSLPIHIKTCTKAFIRTEAEKPLKDRKELPPPPKGFENMLLVAQGKAPIFTEEEKEELLNQDKHNEMVIGGGLTEEQIADKIMEDYRNNAYESYDQNALDGCTYCGRTFNADAMERHSKKCTLKKPLFKPRNGFVPHEPVIKGAEEEKEDKPFEMAFVGTVENDKTEEEKKIEETKVEEEEKLIVD
jgi:hypothetical protein